jgi:hypothetical protein
VGEAVPRYKFAPFSLDPEARVLLREGEPIPMAGKTLDTLLLVVQNRPAVRLACRTTVRGCKRVKPRHVLAAGLRECSLYRNRLTRRSLPHPPATLDFHRMLAEQSSITRDKQIVANPKRPDRFWSVYRLSGRGEAQNHLNRSTVAFALWCMQRALTALASGEQRSLCAYLPGSPLL